MLFLTHITMNNTYLLRDVLSSSDKTHKFVMGFFPDNIGDQPRAKYNILWRREENLDRVPVLLITSTIEPVMNSYSANWLPDVTIKTKEITERYKEILAMDEFSLNVRVKPVKRLGNKEMAIFDEAEALEYFKARLLDRGISVIESKSHYIKDPMVQMGKAKGGLALSAQIVCMAKVVDPEKAWLLVHEGMSRSKAFGYGLVMLGG